MARLGCFQNTAIQDGARAHLLVAQRVHGVRAQEGAGDGGEGDVEVEGDARVARGVDKHVVHDVLKMASHAERSRNVFSPRGSG